MSGVVMSGDVMSGVVMSSGCNVWGCNVRGCNVWVVTSGDVTSGVVISLSLGKRRPFELPFYLNITNFVHFFLQINRDETLIYRVIS